MLALLDSTKGDWYLIGVVQMQVSVPTGNQAEQ